jgi:hypothetical protein
VSQQVWHYKDPSLLKSSLSAETMETSRNIFEVVFPQERPEMLRMCIPSVTVCLRLAKEIRELSSIAGHHDIINIFSII